MSGRITEELTPHLETLAAENGLSLWDVEFVKEGTTWYLRLYIDKPGGIGISDCEQFSHAADPLLDSLDLIDRSYCLEVSSPGIERELRKDSHLAASVGKTVTIKLYEPLNGSKTVIGELISFDGESVTVNSAEPLRILRKNIAGIKLYFDFGTGGKDKK